MSQGGKTVSEQSLSNQENILKCRGNKIFEFYDWCNRFPLIT